MKIAWLGLLGWVCGSVLACSARLPLPEHVAGATTPSTSHPPAPLPESQLWHVPWDGTVSGALVSPDGQWALLSTNQFNAGRSELYRLAEPPGPIADVSALLGNDPSSAAWAHDSKSLVVAIAPKRYGEAYEVALVDLARGLTTARWSLDLAGGGERPRLGFVPGGSLVFAASERWLRAYVGATGEPVSKPIPHWNDAQVSPRVPLAVTSAWEQDEQGFRVLSLPEGRVVADVPLAQHANRFVWSETAAALAVLDGKELIVFRPERPVLRIAAASASHEVVVWGRDAKSIALGAPIRELCPTCARPSSESVRVFSTETGAALANQDFVAESVAWRVTFDKWQLAVDHPVEPRRRPLVDLPRFRDSRDNLSWLDEQHAVLERRDEQIVFDVSTGRVTASGKARVNQTGASDEALSCENDRFERVRRQDGAHLGTFPVPGCPEYLTRSGPYFLYAAGRSNTLADARSGQVLTTFEGTLQATKVGARSVTLAGSGAGKVYCGRIDLGAQTPVAPLELDIHSWGATCVTAADLLVSVINKDKDTKTVTAWRPSTQRFVSRTGREAKAAAAFSCGTFHGVEDGMACVEAGRTTTSVLMYAGRMVSHQVAGSAIQSALSPDGHALAVATDTGKLYLFTGRASDGVPVELPDWRMSDAKNAAKVARLLTFSPDSQWLSVETKDPAGAGLSAYLVPLAAPTRALRLAPKAVESLQFAASSKKLLVRAADQTYVFDLTSQELKAWGARGDSYLTVFHGDERTLVVPAPTGQGQRPVEIVQDGAAIVRGALLDITDAYILLRRDEAVELWTTAGELKGRLPSNLSRVPEFSPSGKLALWWDDDRLSLARVGSTQVLTVLIQSQFDHFYGLLRSDDGRFVGDEQVMGSVRFASGHSWLDALPRSGLDVRGRFERPRLLEEFWPADAPAAAGVAP